MNVPEQLCDTELSAVHTDTGMGETKLYAEPLSLELDMAASAESHLLWGCERQHPPQAFEHMSLAMTVQEEAHHWGQALRIQKPCTVSSVLSDSHRGSRCELLQLPILLLVLSLLHHEEQ